MVPAVKVNNLTYAYQDGVKALDNITFTVEKGSKVALMGHNGAGKSTLLLHFNGLFLPGGGTVKIFDTPVTPKTENSIRRQVGMVFQDPDDQVFSSRVWDDVAFGPINMGLESKEVERRVDQALRDVGMRDYADHTPSQLSYGQKKRVAIAGIIAMAPEIIIFDEPMAFLDPEGQKKLLDTLDNFHQQGKTLIVATHDVDFAAAWADQLIILKQGTLFASGQPGLLADASLVSDARLGTPLVTRVFQDFVNSDRLPVTLSEARELLVGLIDKEGPF